MNCKQWIYFIGICLFSQKTMAQQPNVVLIFTDQWRGSSLGYLGKKKVQTPFLDEFSKQSATLTQFIANYPVCSPSRAIMLTGQHPFKNKVFTNVHSRSAPFGVELPQEITCWSDKLKAKGYFNGYIGKWHLDSPHLPYIKTANNTASMAWNEWTPKDKRHGFDYWYAYGTYDSHLRPMYWDNDAQREEFHYVDQWGPEHEADKAIDFFKNDKGERATGKPFSLVISMNPPHTDYRAVPKKYLDKYDDVPLASLLTDPDIPGPETEMGKAYRNDIKYYYAAITGVDEQIGRIIAGLKSENLLNNTIVIITADHGNCLGKHEKGTKKNIYEASLKIPFIIYWHNKINPQINDTNMASLFDFYPTLLDLCGIKPDAKDNLIGESFARSLLNGKSAEAITQQFFMGEISERNKQSGFRGIRTPRYKLSYQKTANGITPSFFDLETDPFELNNIYSEDSATVKDLKKKIKAHLKANSDPFADLI